MNVQCEICFFFNDIMYHYEAFLFTVLSICSYLMFYELFLLMISLIVMSYIFDRNDYFYFLTSCLSLYLIWLYFKALIEKKLSYLLLVKNETAEAFYRIFFWMINFIMLMILKYAQNVFISRICFSKIFSIK